MSAYVDGRRAPSGLHRQRRADGQSVGVECLYRSDGLQLGDRPAVILDVSDTDLRNARYLDTHRMQVRPVVEMQRAPDPVHGPPVPHSPGVVALPRRGVEGIATAVDGDGSCYGAGYLVPCGDPVLIRRAVGGPLQINLYLGRRARLCPQQSGRVLVGLALSTQRHPV